MRCSARRRPKASLPLGGRTYPTRSVDGGGRAAPYYHFRSKDEILVALLEPGTGLLGEFLERLTAADGVEAWGDALAWIIDQMFDHLEFLRLIQRNRNTVAALHVHLDALSESLDMQARVEEAVKRVTPDLREQVRKIAALGAVTGFDDWAPELLAGAPLDELRAELIAAARTCCSSPRAVVNHTVDVPRLLHHTDRQPPS